MGEPIVLICSHRAGTSGIDSILVVRAATHWSICIHIHAFELAVTRVGHHLALGIG